MVTTSIYCSHCNAAHRVDFASAVIGHVHCLGGYVTPVPEEQRRLILGRVEQLLFSVAKVKE